MNRSYSEDLETWLQNTARNFPYPATPDIARAVLQRQRGGRLPVRRLPSLRGRLAWSLALLAVGVLALLAVPSVRAGIADLIQVGIVRIFQGEPPTIATTVPAATPSPGPTPTLLPRLIDLSGRMSLAEARRLTAPLPLPLPTYPPGLGEPDYVFVQDMQAWAAILVWMDPEQPGRIRLSLHIIEPGGFAVDKVNPETVEETQVNGLPAFWTTGPYVVRLHGDELDVRRLIEGHVLIWEEAGVTYRVETDLPLEEAVKIAESLEP